MCDGGQEGERQGTAQLHHPRRPLQAQPCDSSQHRHTAAQLALGLLAISSIRASLKYEG